MVGLGTVLNIIGIAAGGAIGALVGHRMREEFRHLTTDLLGLVTGLSAALSAKAVMSPVLQEAVGSTWPLFIVLAALLVGGAIGSLLKIEYRLEKYGQALKDRFARNEGSFVEGFLSASLIFCIGPLAIMGSFDDALGLGIDKLVLKSVLDFFTSIAFAASLGWGVAASAIAVGVYQGALTVLGLALGNVWDAAQIDAMTAVGGLLLLAISLRLLNIKHIAIGNVLPALFLAPVFVQLIVALS